MIVRNIILKTLRGLVAPSLLFWGLPALMALVVLGTVAQMNMGLYEAQQAYFNSLIAWVDTPYISLPMPGGLLIMGLLTLSLTVKFLIFTPWRVEKIGVFFSHLGVLLLMYGAIASAVFGSEGFMVLREGEASNLVHSYHERRLLIDDGKQAIFEGVIANAPAEIIATDGLDVQLVEIIRHAALLGDTPDTQTVDALEPDKEDEANRRAVLLAVNGKAMVLHEDMPQPTVIDIEAGHYRFALRRSVKPLDFDLRLKDFRRDVYAGTNMAKNYMSGVVVEDAGKTLPSLIQMNHPLRYKGYTFYQSSFEEDTQGDVSVLTVVHNPARLFPYIGTVLLSLGLLLHLLIMSSTKTRQRGQHKSV